MSYLVYRHVNYQNYVHKNHVVIPVVVTYLSQAVLGFNDVQADASRAIVLCQPHNLTVRRFMGRDLFAGQEGVFRAYISYAQDLETVASSATMHTGTIVETPAL